jgi:ribosomal protein S18 acetylase RimI-like enzyme
MEILKFNESYMDGVVKLWNECCQGDMPYKKFTKESFEEKFLKNVNFDYDGTFVGVRENKVIGFANGICKKEFLNGENSENTPGYLTIIIVDKKYRNKGYGSELLKRLEMYFENKGKKRIDIIFFNPINLEWNIKGSNNHDHNNAPGVDVEGLGYEFLLNRGYLERTKEAAMYLPLGEFKLNDEIKNKHEILNGHGIEIEYYTKSKQYGFEELFDDLKNEQWRKEILDNAFSEKSYPLIVASTKGKVCGFAGPIKVQKSGRGWFSGIGVHSDYGGKGIGTVLFFKLCEAFKGEGAEFMSLFTGVNNNARKMYEKAGFRIVKKWSVMRKEL